jgi:uncharacterized protein YeaO (DUF488 family)
VAEGDRAKRRAPDVVGHDPERWQEFRERYFKELGGNASEVARLVNLLSAGKVTLLFGAHDVERNNAVALVEYLASP